MAGRIAHLAGLAVVHAFGFLLDWIEFSMPKRRMGYRPSTLSLAGGRLVRFLEAAGPVFVKFGQVLSSRPDFVPPELIARLARLQENVSAVPQELIVREIERSLGKPIQLLFRDFDLVPISSASVAQVHRASLWEGREPSGSEVAVKVRRPDVIARIRVDSRVMFFFARLIERLPGMRTVPCVAMLEQFTSQLTLQLDFRNEASNNARLRANLQSLPDVKIPLLYIELCSDSVLTMEFLSGLTRCAQAVDWPIGERRAAALRSVQVVYSMTFRDGFLHGDLHPGNIFLRRGGQIVLLDLGLMAELKGENVRHFAGFFFSVVTNSGRECAKIVWNTAIARPPAAALKAFEQDMVALVAVHSGKRAREFEVTRFAYDLFECQRRHKVRGSVDFLTTILSFAVFEGFAKQLDPELDFQGEARQYIPLVIRRLGNRTAEPAVAR